MTNNKGRSSVGDIDNFIDTFADGGVVVERTNVFTIDFRRQALKLAPAANIVADELVFLGFRVALR